MQLLDALRVLYSCEYRMFEQSFNYRKLIKIGLAADEDIFDNENAEDIEKYYSDKYSFSTTMMDKEYKRNERMIFQLKRAEQMSVDEYKEYASYRETTLLKQGKKKLTNSIKIDCKDNKSIEFISYLAKEFIEDTIERALFIRDGKFNINHTPILNTYIEDAAKAVSKKHITKLNKVQHFISFA
jgi:hypothetical protein